MDKDLRTLAQAIRKVVASDHRIRGKISSAKKICANMDQNTPSIATQESPEPRIVFTKGT